MAFILEFRRTVHVKSLAGLARPAGPGSRLRPRPPQAAKGGVPALRGTIPRAEDTREFKKREKEKGLMAADAA